MKVKINKQQLKRYVVFSDEVVDCIPFASLPDPIEVEAEPSPQSDVKGENELLRAHIEAAHAVKKTYDAKLEKALVEEETVQGEEWKIEFDALWAEDDVPRLREFAKDFISKVAASARLQGQLNAGFDAAKLAAEIERAAYQHVEELADSLKKNDNQEHPAAAYFLQGFNRALSDLKAALPKHDHQA